MSPPRRWRSRSWSAPCSAAQRALRRDRGAAAAAGQRMLVVLPFRNLGDSADAYFADGLTEELTSRLASLGGLRVISRTSAEQYRASTRPLKEIGAELGAGYVLEGSVHLDRGAAGASRVRVRPRLISVANDSQLWTEPYEVELTEVFRVQTDIAERVSRLARPRPARAGARGAREGRHPRSRGLRLLPAGERLPRPEQPAGGPVQRGQPLHAGGEADPASPPRGRSSRGATPRSTGTTTTARRARLALAKARWTPPCGSRPSCPRPARRWGSIATGACSTTRARSASSRRRSASSRATAICSRRSATSSDAAGAGRSRSAGFVEALRYDPRSGQRSFDVGDNYFSLQMFREADHYLERAMTLSPDWSNPYIYRAWLQVVWRGDLARGRELMAQGLARIEPGRFAAGAADGRPDLGLAGHGRQHLLADAGRPVARDLRR